MILQKVNRARKIIYCGAALVLLYNLLYAIFFTVLKVTSVYENHPWLDKVDTITSLIFIIPFRILEMLLIVYLSRLGIKLINMLTT